jgi:hypothetical protein
MPETRAAQLVGLDRSILSKWKERGSKETSGPYFDFFNDLCAGEPKFELANLSIIAEAGKRDWRAAAHL